MNRLKLRALALACLLVGAALPLAAHHSTLPFDGEHATVIEGIVTRFEWRNPHSRVYLDVQVENGGVEHWTIETESLIVLSRLGWTKEMLKPGDRITTTGARAKNGSHMMRCKVLDLADGREVPCFPNS
jgi:hypothetical protein